LYKKNPVLFKRRHNLNTSKNGLRDFTISRYNFEPLSKGAKGMYEVSSIKNANLSIKYEGIKLKMCLIACKKGINVVVRFQYSEIG